MILNKLKIDDAKTEFIVFRSPMPKHDLSDLSVNVGGNLIKPSVQVRDLGVILDQTISFDDHISAVCQSTHFHIRNIGSIRNLSSFDACAILIHALIGNRLDYCNLLLYNIADAKIERLQKVQNQAARILTKSPRKDHITPVLKQLHWLKVRERIQYKVLILAHKSFYETAPQYLSSLVTRKDYLKNTRFSTDHYLIHVHLCTPPLSKDCFNTFLERSFLFSAPREWNSLDESIRKSDYNMFKKSVKTELFVQCYEC